MKSWKLLRLEIPLAVTAWGVITCLGVARGQDADNVETQAADRAGPEAALDFERSFRDPSNGGYWNPVPLDQCQNITELTKDLWSKKQVLTHFKEHRSENQIGVIVFAKTEYCCDNSRLCAVTTACLEKRSTPLVDRFMVYGGWIRNHPDHTWEEWNQWDENVIAEYAFIQGPGARIVVMVPLWNGKMYQWESTASELEFSRWEFESRDGKTPALERFLQKAIKHAPTSVPAVAN